MKSQRRHELQTNELAAMYDKHADEIKSGGKIAAGVVAVLVIGFAIWAYMSSSQQARLAKGWEAFDEARSGAGADTEALEEMAGEFSDTLPALWAQKTAADRKLATGMQELRVNRDDATEKIDEAIEVYEKIVGERAGDTMFQQQCLLGLGKAHESLSNVEEAKEQYKKAIAKNAASALGKYAQKRVDFLSQPKNAAWYAWFADQEPRTPAPPSIPGMTPGNAGDDLPAAPDISLEGDGLSFEGVGSSLENDKPKEGQTTPPAEVVPAEEKPAEDKPAEEKPAEEKPAEEKPAEDKPAEDKPAEDKPAEEKPAEAKPAEEKPAEDKPAEETESQPSADAGDDAASGDSESAESAEGSGEAGTDASTDAP